MSKQLSLFEKARLMRSLLVVALMLSAGCGGQAESPAPRADQPGQATGDGAIAVEDLSNSTDEDAVRVLFLGDSITAGYGIDQTDAFPARVEMRLNDSGYNVEAIDAGVSGDTSTGGLNRLDWLLQNRVDVLVLELGGNDGLRGIDLRLTRSNLGAIIEQTRTTWPEVEVILVGMQVPPNLGSDYTEEFASMYPEVAEAHSTHFVPFLADGFEDIVHLLQNDGIHPTEEGHALIADKVVTVLEPIVANMQEAD